jgi:EPS-associated MarR family transcriptional regulator
MLSKKNQYQILKSIEHCSISTQRQLSSNLGTSLGKVNYIIKSLAKKGLIKINNFRNNKNKIQYSYLLTSKGIEVKAKIILDFIKIKTRQYYILRQDIESLNQEAKNIEEESLLR